MPVTWSDEKLILLYCPGRGSNSRPPAHRSFKHGQGVPHPNHSATAAVLAIGRGTVRIHCSIGISLMSRNVIKLCFVVVTPQCFVIFSSHEGHFVMMHYQVHISSVVRNVHLCVSRSFSFSAFNADSRARKKITPSNW